MKTIIYTMCLSFLLSTGVHAQSKAVVADSATAKQLGADERGMRRYILVILKTGPKRVPDGPDRTNMLKGHFDNMERLAKAGKLVLAGPFEDKTDWRGMFIFAVPSLEEAETLVATDPVIKSGEMVAEYHALYASAALMTVSSTHERIAPQ
ncbi:YciI family protein [Lysobacter koreensis]|uniref:YciI family protein n=1 Tax=Lysobacter koreensis TaxID=266122 RepID=A0ABW2YQH2_9GAMM